MIKEVITLAEALDLLNKQGIGVEGHMYRRHKDSWMCENETINAEYMAMDVSSAGGYYLAEAYPLYANRCVKASISVNKEKFMDIFVHFVNNEVIEFRYELPMHKSVWDKVFNHGINNVELCNKFYVKLHWDAI